MEAQVPVRFSPLQGDVTALQIAEEVVRLVREQPLRCLMDSWVTTFREDRYLWDLEMPPCGTVACLAGWIAILTNQDERPSSSLAAARRVMAGREDWPLNDDLYVDEDHPVSIRLRKLDEVFLNWDIAAKAGTPEYVEQALAPFLAYIEEYKEELAVRIIFVQ